MTVKTGRNCDIFLRTLSYKIFILICSFLIPCFALESCSEDNKIQEPFVITSETEYAVYRALIEEMYVHDGVKLIVMVDRTVFDSTPIVNGIFHQATSFSVLPETVASIQNQNQQSQAIECKKLELSVPCTILAQRAFRELFDADDEQPHTFEDNWDRFYEKYPGSQGIMQLSRVGFDTKGSQVLTHVGNQSRALAGAGYYVLLVRKDDTWVIHSKLRTWQS